MKPISPGRLGALCLAATTFLACDGSSRPGAHGDTDASHDPATVEDAGDDLGRDAEADGQESDGGSDPGHDADVSGGNAAGPDAGDDEPDAQSPGPGGCNTEPNGKLDLLFVIDNSKSMSDEQEKLSAQLPRMLTALTSGDIDDDGVKEFEPAQDLHLGVVSTDMGGSGINIQIRDTCDTNNHFGDDGRLINTSRATSAPCAGQTLAGGGNYLSFVPGEQQTPEEVAQNFACVANLGVTGCGFEQQLEAMYKALAPSSVTFGRGTGGHGDGLNAGFLRPDAVLAVVHVTDEEDCSITEQGADLFIPLSNNPAVLLPDGMRIGLNLRCAYRVDDHTLLHAPERYIDGLKALKPDHPERIVFAAITGVPPQLESASFDAILAAPEMQFAADPTAYTGGDMADNTTPVRPACGELATNGGGYLSSATPGRRFVEVAQGFGERGVVRSICSNDYRPAVRDIVQAIGVQLGCPPLF